MHFNIALLYYSCFTVIIISAIVWKPAGLFVFYARYAIFLFLMTGDVIPDSENTYWWMTSTSFPPQGTEGQIVLLPVSKVNSSLPLSPMVVSSSEIEQNWYYSKIEWVDMNQDGWLDVVTSRSRGRSESIQFSQLLWYENPGYGLLWSRGR